MDGQDWASIKSEIESLPLGDREQGQRRVASQGSTPTELAQDDLEALLRHIEEALRQDVDPV